jgi:hypothetical protein
VPTCNQQASPHEGKRIPTRRAAAIVIKLGISTLLVWLVTRGIELGDLADRLVTLDWPVVGVIALASLAQIPLTASRWSAVLGALGTGIRAVDSLRVTAIGLFFNAALPAIIGGDVVRVYYARDLGVRIRTGIHSVLLDRLTALVALILMAAVGLPWSLALIGEANLRTGLVVAVLLGLAGSAALFVLADMVRLFSRWRYGHAAAVFAEACARVFRRARPAGTTLGISAAVHFLDIIKAYAAAVGLGTPLTFLDLVLLLPPVILGAVLPVSIAGWGVREAAMVVALGQVGIAPVDALAISLAVGLSQIGIGVPGGFLWLAAGWKRVVRSKQ